jgi:hypothetical protein
MFIRSVLLCLHLNYVQQTTCVWETGIWFPALTRCCLHVQTSPEVQQNTRWPFGTKNSFPRKEKKLVRYLPTQLYLIYKLRIRGTQPPLRIYLHVVVHNEAHRLHLSLSSHISSFNFLFPSPSTLTFLYFSCLQTRYYET